MAKIVKRLNLTAVFHIFEPQPVFAHLIRTSVAPAIRRLGSVVHFNQAAAYVRDGNITFHLSRLNSETASINSRTVRGLHLKGGTILAQTIDIDAYLAKVIAPGVASSFLKLDIESGEFEVLPHLLKRQNAPICRISNVLVEWHMWDNVNTSPENVALRRDLTLTFQRKCAGTALSYRRTIDADGRYASVMGRASPSPPTITSTPDF